jgi:Uncharacterized protein conserved in bacteria
MNKDKAAGFGKEVEGKAKEVAGKIIGDPKLQAEGMVEQGVGKAQQALGDIKDKLKAD